MRYDDQRVLVLGAARSGRAAARLLLARGAHVSVYDRDPARSADLPQGIERLHGPALPSFDGFDRVVQSPGVPVASHPRLIPEVDLAAVELQGPLIGVTGTNGKSTTSMLIGEMLRQSGASVAVGGNLGTPLCDLVDEKLDWLVAELSSFQLEHARAVRARVAVLLNLTPDHLDRHGSLDAYGRAKARLAELQDSEGVLVANADDAWACSVAERSAARVLFFSMRAAERSSACMDGQELVLSGPGLPELRVHQDALSRASRTPVDNALAAALTAAACGASQSAIRSVLTGFEGLPHRGALVCTRRGVRFVDDSKATNPAAAARSLAAQPAPIVWIAGGRNKGLDLGELAAAARGVRAALLIGEAADELAAALTGATEVVRLETLDQAVPEAARRAGPGGSVLLAPACTSLDQFASFEARGARFAELARALPDVSSEDEPC